jgi:hypothetical protein
MQAHWRRKQAVQRTAFLRTHREQIAAAVTALQATLRGHVARAKMLQKLAAGTYVPPPAGARVVTAAAAAGRCPHTNLCNYKTNLFSIGHEIGPLLQTVRRDDLPPTTSRVSAPARSTFVETAAARGKAPTPAVTPRLK